MSTPLRVLIVEDSPSDAKLMVAELREAGFDPVWQRVETEASYVAQLESAPDLILSDFNMPQFNGLKALQHLRERNLDIPFLFVSGTIGEDVAVQALQEGADDYLKKDRLGRLGQAVRRALLQKELREKNRQNIDQLNLQASALAAAANGILITDGQGIICWSNPAVTAMTGFSADEMLGKTPRIFRSGRHDQSFYEGLWHTLKAGRVWKGDIVNRRKNGEHYPEEQTITPVRNGAGTISHFVAIKQDVSQLRQAKDELLKTEQQYRQAQKMEAVGRLAGGVAHDFNNLLTVICGYGELLIANARLDDASLPMLKTIVQAGEQAAMLTRQLLTFSHQHVHEVQLLDINVIVRESEKMLTRLIGEDIRIEMCLVPTVMPVLADPGHLNQIIMNLAVNARDAMPGGGNLRIETANVDPDNRDAADSDSPRPGPFVRLKITDTGCGMDEPTRLRIFEPFFTTKGPGKGTGLGLSTVYGIVHKCDGRIEVDSSVGNGTTFRIYFPVAQPKLQTNSPTARKAAGPDGTETILLVEDDDTVRYLANLLLGKRGYKVLEADCGAAALALVESRKEPIHLLLTDVVMPEMSGRVLADRLKCIHPESVVLFMSGYTGETLTHHRVNEPGAFFLQKPFTPGSLVAKVRDVLDSFAANPL